MEVGIGLYRGRRFETRMKVALVSVQTLMLSEVPTRYKRQRQT